MNALVSRVSVIVWVALLAGTAFAVNIETVRVGNPGNAGEWSGQSYGGYGPDRICGAVDYTYNIGKYEVTAGQYTEFLNKVAATDAYGLYNTSMWSSSYGCKIQRSGISGSYTYSVASDYANRPVNCVSWGDSARFANWLHNGQPTGPQGLSTTEDGAYYLNGATTNAQLLAVNRESDWKWAITSEDEWYKAAYHKNDGVTGNYFNYPTSSDSVPGRDLSDASGNNANYYGSPSPIDSPYYTTVAGEFQNSDSPYGTFDQGGNVWEWNEAVLYGSYRGLRGGSFSLNDYYLLASGRYHYFPSDEYDSIGFRVSEVPEPGTMALLAFGGIGVLRRRRGLRR
ncbi:MAG: SUMF1/EgtB/PvdO family nonheme iron enzyme [Phycisphaerae bacterium]|nr:SUMF1/EgtB/PvdO family nonheme iron enzyme [Phycisphaerae bacterium]